MNQGIPPERFTVLHNAISPDDFFATRDPLLVRAELGAMPDTPVVGTFAHLSPKKGHRELLEAIPTVLRQLPNAQFWIVGDGVLWKDLQLLAERTGIMSNIRFLGFRRDVANLMNAINVMALPSRREPCASLMPKPRCRGSRVSAANPAVRRIDRRWRDGPAGPGRRSCRVGRGDASPVDQSRLRRAHGAGRVCASRRYLRLGASSTRWNGSTSACSMKTPLSSAPACVWRHSLLRRFPLLPHRAVVIHDDKLAPRNRSHAK